MIRVAQSAMVGLTLLLFAPGEALSQGCFKFTIITTSGQTNPSVVGFAPYVPDANAPKIFFSLTMSNYAHMEWFQDYGLGEVPRYWNGTNHMDLTSVHHPTNGQTAGSGSAYYQDYFDYVPYSSYQATNAYPTNQWTGDPYNYYGYILETESSGTPTTTESSYVDTVSWNVNDFSFNSVIKYTLTNELGLTNFAVGIATPSPQMTNTYDSPSIGTLICSRQATWDGDYTTFNGTVVDMTGTVQFESKTNVDYEISWDETDVNGTVISQTIIVTGTGNTITNTFFDPGPPAGIGAVSASGIMVIEIGGLGCSGTCTAPGPAIPGGPGPYPKCARLDMGLGRAGPGRSAGLLRFTEERPRSNMATPNRLAFIGTTNFVTVVTDGSGSIRQALAPQCLADVVTINSNRYDVRFYGSTNVGSLTGSVYQVTGSPFLTWTIENPDTTGTNWNRLRMSETRGANVVTNEFLWSDATQSWTLTSGNGLKQESKQELWNNDRTQYTEVWTVLDPATSGVVSVKSNFFTVFGFGKAKVEERVGTGTAQQVTTYSYYTDPEADGVAYGRLKQTVHPNGSWEIRTYDGSGRLSKTYTSFGNQDPTTQDADCRVTEYDYTPMDGSGDDGSISPRESRRTIETLLGTEVGRSYAIYLANETWQIRCQTAGAAWDAADNLVTVTTTYDDGDFKGWPKSELRPNGTLSLYEYSVGGGGNLTNTVYSGQPNGGGTAVVAGNSQITVQGPFGNTLSRTTVDIASQITTGSETFSSFDEFGRAGRVTYLDATFKLISYSCCNLDSETDRDGIVTSYSYDALKRRITSTRNGISHISTLDAAGREWFTQRQGTNSSTILLSSRVYDTVGRVLYQTNALGNVTRFGESIDGSGQTVKVTTNALGGTRIETYFKDGSLQSITGTAAHGVRYEYGIENDFAYTKEIKLLTDGTDSSEWTKSLMDTAGRSFKAVFPDDAYTQSYYNNAGQLWKQRDTDGVVTLYAYNAEGAVEYTALDMDQNDTIDFGGTDRITQTVRDVAAAHSTNVRRTRSYVWAVNSSTDALLTSTVEAAVDGTRSWQTAFGLTNQSITLCGSTCVATNIAPNGSYAVTLKTNGYVLSATRYSPSAETLSAITYSYDEHGRQKTMTDARNGTTTNSYDVADRITSVTTPVPASGQSAQTTTRYYDDLGQVWKTVQPDGTSVTNEFHLTGEPKKTYGSRTYPVEYTYDYAGRQLTLKTWQDFTGNAVTATTTWNYSSTRGWLTSKQYADDQGPSYTYTSAGRLATRTWARGVTATYSYDNAGQLSGIDYSDSTPDVTFTYDRQGRQTANAAGGLTTTRDYNPASQLIAESYSGGVLDGLSITNTYDSLLRRSSLTLQPLNSSTLYSYDSSSRLSTVSDGTNSATYAYLANSPLVDTVVFQQNATTRMTRTNRYDYLNRLTSVTSSVGGTPVSSFNYAYNDANQRVAVTNVDSTRWSWGYDALGQVTSGKKYWSDNTVVAGQQFEYAFDDIGNRKQTAAGGNQSGTSLRTNTYGANLLNQYTNRTVGGYVEVLGSANSSATVTVNNESTYRKGAYFRKELSVDNTSAAGWPGITNVAVLAGAGTNGADIVTTKTGNLLVPQTPETFTYDADGNTTSDGRFTYTWDAENRLLGTESLTTAPAGSRVRQEWTHLPDGRWAQRIISTWDGSAYVPQSTNRFVWDDKVLLAVLNGNNQPEQTYLLGSDLSGTPQGAGGVGGLLAVNLSTNGTHFACFDGNGNVATLVSTSTGTETARYEYDPFGNTLRATGPAAEANSLRFSTQFADDLTRRVKYLYRDYDAGMGRWLSRDPIEERGGINLTSFLKNDSVSFTDTHGLSVWDAMNCACRKAGGIPMTSARCLGFSSTWQCANSVSLDAGVSALLGAVSLAHPVAGMGVGLGVLANWLMAYSLCDGSTCCKNGVPNLFPAPWCPTCWHN